MDRLLLIDGHSILTRAFYGVPELSTKSGIHTNAVYGFLNIMLKCAEDERAGQIMAAFDVDRRTLKRTGIYDQYKGTRKPMPKELKEQVPLIQDILKAMGIPVLSLEGYEADDILGTVAERAAASGTEVTIISGDRDLLQLCNDHVKIAIPRTSRGRTEVSEYYPEDVLKEYRVEPGQFADLKALMGDSSDNIPGLPGVGQKTAAGIIEKYGTIENAREHAAEVKPPRASRALLENFELAELSKKLAVIDTNVPLEIDMSLGKVSLMYTNEALQKLRELELKALSARFSEKVPESGGEESGEKVFNPNTKLVTDRFLAGVVYKDAETEPLAGFRLFYGGRPENPSYVVLGLSLSGDRVYCICSSEKYAAARLIEDLCGMLGKRIAAGLPSATLDLKEQLKCLDIKKNGCIHDLKLAQYMLDPNANSYEYDDLARNYLGLQLKSRKELIGKNDIYGMIFAEEGGQMTLFPAGGRTTEKESAGCAKERDQACMYASLNSLIPRLTYEKLNKLMEGQGVYKLYEEVELPLLYTLDAMEKVGVAADGQALNNYASFLKGQIDGLTEKIYLLSGEEFNINSPQQLGAILFEKLGIKGGKKTKTGYSTAADVLEKLADEHEVIPAILRYRALTKLYSTYAKGLAEYIREDGRIHGTFNQTIAATGRISSTDPNLQNIPIRTNEGREIRRVFVPAEGFTFVDADYSQIELRVLAALSKDESLIAAYENAVDIHALTASQVFHVPIDEVTPDLRRRAKAVNFGIVYGISAFGLGEDLDVSRKEASEYIEKYFETYPGVKAYLDGCVKEAREKGYVKTYYGRIRNIPELKSSNYMQRSFGERVAMNSPIQGTAADIMKIAMIKTDEALKGMKSHIVLQVHDELLIETARDEVSKVMDLVRECMEQACDIGVKLCADVKSGDTWYECH